MGFLNMNKTTHEVIRLKRKINTFMNSNKNTIDEKKDYLNFLKVVIDNKIRAFLDKNNLKDL